jgi:serine/threonine-protein kinase
MHPAKLGPYNITGKIGEGGMGSVYLGTHEEDGREAAIKLLPAEMAKRPGFRERFEAEIESLRKLEHPNIVGLYGFGEELNQLFYVMEYVPGKNLQEEIDSGRQFSWARVVDMGIGLAEALRHAHLHGIIHRDIKPANIMTLDDGTPKLTDFGIARLYGVEGLTMAGGPLGTAHYMAPEQASSNNKITEHADIYALGATFYTLLAGRPPFQAQSMLQILDMHKRQTPLPVNQVAPDVPEELSVVISTMLAKKPEDRVASATMLIKSLRAVRDAVAFRQNTLKPATPLPPRPTTQQDIRTQILGSTDKDSPTIKLDDQQTLAGDAAFDPDQTLATSLPIDQTVDPDATIISSDSTAIPLQTHDQTEVGTDDDYELADEERKSEQPSSMFITAEQARQMDRDREAEEARRQPRTVPVISITLFVLGLVAVGVLWHWSRPLGQEELLRRINAMAESSDAYEQSVLMDYIEQYQAMAGPNDPNQAELAQLKNDLDVQDLERKLRQRARYRVNNSSSLSMIEQVLLDAIHLIPDDPKLAMDRLAALQTLYADPSIKRDKREQRLLDVADLLKERAAQTLASYQATRLKAIDEQLDRARQFLQTNPNRSLQVAQAVITLYSHQAWAKQQIQRAQMIIDQAKTKINAQKAN